jgi:hypothetical protein
VSFLHVPAKVYNFKKPCQHTAQGKMLQCSQLNYYLLILNMIHL